LIKTPFHFFKVGIIGSVCTDPKARGKGLAASIMKSILEEATEQSCDLAILWTDINSFYQKLGFIDGGREVLVKFPEGPLNNNVRGETDEVHTQASNLDPKVLLGLFNKHQLRSIRTPNEIQKLLKIPESTLWTSWNKSKTQLKAYAVVGKGADFKNFIHEWGGEVSSLLPLFSTIKKNLGLHLNLITPPDCHNLISSLVKMGCSTKENPLAMIKIVSPVEFCRKITKGARALGLSNFVFEYKEQGFVFGIQGETYKTERGSDIVQLVFGPRRPKEIFPFSQAALDVFEQIFPIPFWVWGWDSI